MINELFLSNGYHVGKAISSRDHCLEVPPSKPLGARIQRAFGKWKCYARSATTTETVMFLFRPNTKKLKASS